ncbi:hypothetical protein GMA19_02300 [Paenibacillus polymyxa E681]|uniref:hypothetical protein n=1 Tax=Paenibacillus polymyxa TaxID=1406 RepID=UPI000CD350E1|nr:hypothetical protein [Paenibacillus polymyxa]ADM70105.2 hypothetical protein PPE_02272 [Paenibacillus polymyxa E681]QNV57133.1 hypothetical protein GE561_02300 [Paenibacillus polymyxa E681]QNV61970.1 hypothetical protein GMA19_02300 [Paenibacillus polymyxa E681]
MCEWGWGTFILHESGHGPLFIYFQLVSHFILQSVSSKREPQDKLIGHYKVGDLAIATMIKLGEKEDEMTGFKILDEFEKKMVFRLFEEIEW